MLRRLLFILVFTSGLASAADRPNILWLSCEDISPHLGCYGDSDAITPNLDRLATEGVRYSHAFTAAGVCAPCRSTVITGMYQTTIGTHHMRCKSTLPEEIQPFPVYLRQAGYYCTNNSKQDYQFRPPRGTWDESSGKAHWKKRKDGQPFFAVFNFTGCHESGIAGEAKYKSVTKDLKADQRRDPGKLKLPPYYPDTPVVREDWKRNYELITAMDAWAGDLIEELKKQGVYEDTIIMYWSDHGVGLPRAKRWLYDSGTRVPLIVRIPEKFRASGQGKAGTVDDQLVSSLDFGPTVLNLAGLKVPGIMQGRAFLGSDLTPARDYVYGARDRMDERYDIIRAVRDKRFRYIRNYEPWKPYYQYMNTPEKGATMKEIRRVQSEGKLPEEAALFTAESKPLEELYDLESDPHEVKNLAADPAYHERLEKMREVHLKWVADTRDLGLIPESEIVRREEKAGSRYAILRDARDPDLASRIRDVATSKKTEDFLDALEDKDSVVRYWGAIGLGNLEKLPKAAGAKLEILLQQDQAPAVRIAAARAMLHDEIFLPHLRDLARELKGKQEWARLRAAIVLDELDEGARPVLEDLKKSLKGQPNKYIVRVVNRAVNELEGTKNAVK